MTNVLSKKLTKRRAALTAVVIMTLAALATIWPMRLYKEDISKAGGEIIQPTEVVDADNDAGDYFIAQYDHLQSMEVSIEEVVTEGSFLFQLFGKLEGGFALLAQEEVPVRKDMEGGFAFIPVDVDLTPGEEYVFTVRGHESAFRAGCESMENSGGQNAPVYTVGFYHDTGIDGLAVAARLNYRVPLGKVNSAMAGAAILLAAVLISSIIGWYYVRFPERNRQITILRMLQCWLTPVLTIIFALAAAAVWPMKLFDDRPADILFYEAGILLGFVICMYGLWHKRPGTDLVTDSAADSGTAEQKQTFVAAERTQSFSVDKGHIPAAGTDKCSSMVHLLIIICIALIFAVCTDYMNALNDFVHHTCESQLMILLSVIVIAMGASGRRPAFIKATGISTLVGALGGTIYYRRSCLPETADQFELFNGVLSWQTAAWICFAVAVVGMLADLAGAVRSGKGKEKESEGEARGKMSIRLQSMLRHVPLALLILLAVCMTVQRNGRWWIVELVVMYVLFYIRYATWKDWDGWLRDLCIGAAAHFCWAAGYSMLHRYYFAYFYNRFSMQFHTVTVTAYYLLIMETAAMTLLMVPWRRLQEQKKTPGEILSALWKEMLLFGAVTSYLLMSLSRAGIGIMAIFFVVVPFVTFSGSRRFWQGALRTLAWMAVIVLVTFPVIFTGQRIISTVAHAPRRFEALEPFPDAIMRNPEWDSRWFMSVEVFTEDFLERIIGGPAAALADRMKQADDGQWVELDPDMIIVRNTREPGMEHIRKAPAAASSDASDAFRMADNSNHHEISTVFHRTQAAVLYRNSILPAVLRRMVLAQADGTGEGLDAGDYSNGRLDLYRAYLQELDMAGHDYMGATLPDGEIAVHAHNIFLQAAFDCGIPAGAALLAYLAALFFASWSFFITGEAENRYRLLPLLMVAGFAVTGMVEWIFHFCNPYTVMLLLSAAPVLIGQRQTKLI